MGYAKSMGNFISSFFGGGEETATGAVDANGERVATDTSRLIFRDLQGNDITDQVVVVDPDNPDGVLYGEAKEQSILELAYNSVYGQNSRSDSGADVRGNVYGITTEEKKTAGYGPSPRLEPTKKFGWDVPAVPYDYTDSEVNLALAGSSQRLRTDFQSSFVPSVEAASADNPGFTSGQGYTLYDQSPAGISQTLRNAGVKSPGETNFLSVGSSISFGGAGNQVYSGTLSPELSLETVFNTEKSRGFPKPGLVFPGENRHETLQRLLKEQDEGKRSFGDVTNDINKIIWEQPDQKDAQSK